MGEFVLSLRHGGRLPRVDILPYHKMGLDKYLRLGRAYSLPYVTQPKDEIVHSVQGEIGAVWALKLGLGVTGDDREGRSVERARAWLQNPTYPLRGRNL